ncbi:MAG: ABC transporter ATP-binding protein [Candidatus Faecousia sp.]|uniref:ABC transporter ATP-binding protein n=1 Tax=Faecousia sp. TaxID=2952921 RepID=UPI002A8D95B3|nr:ABC transporter ATP-binding protein [Candidatus Faecousia sp.]
MTTTIVCEKLCKSYAGTQALRDVDLHLPAGRIVGLLGPNGSGKTTLIKILAGLLCPTSGQATICGEPIGVSTKARVSYLPDKMYYAGWMRANDLMELFSDFYADFRRDRAEAMCRALGIDLSAKVKSMSKGTKEKLQLILVMCRQASVYLLDEPIAGVDPAAREFILQTILTNYSPESTVLISTHLIADVEPVLDEAVFLKDGSVVIYDAVDNIRTREGKSLDAVFRDVFRTVPFGGAWPC